jgi:hypothetical protein
MDTQFKYPVKLDMTRNTARYEWVIEKFGKSGVKWKHFLDSNHRWQSYGFVEEEDAIMFALKWAGT